MELVLPDLRFKKSYIAAQRELRAEGAAQDIDFDRLKFRFEHFVQMKLLQRQGKCLPAGFVPATEFWMAEGNHFLGRVVLRHSINESLEKFGGHIGYEVRPTERRKGYACLGLSLVLPEARKLGLSAVLITCDDTNVGSIRVIERNGGDLIDRIQIPDRQVPTRRYRIQL